MSLSNTLAKTYIISYAQFCEDIILYSLLYHIQKGFYVDVGCSDPVDLSVTKLFYDKGWIGINIDPRVEAMQKFDLERINDINCCLGASNKEGELIFWESGVLSTFDEITYKSLKQKGFEFTITKAMVRKLTNILIENCHVKDIHFLKIDAEHHEKEVLEGLDLLKFRPWVLVVESTHPTTQDACYFEWEYIILNKKYVFFTENSINRYYLANEKEKELISQFITRPFNLVMHHKHLANIERIEEIAANYASYKY